MKLSIVIPVYNEEKTIETTIRKVLMHQLPRISSREIVAVGWIK